MTAAALTRFGRSDHHPHGWLASFVVHGIALSIAVLLFSELRPSAQTEPFHWEIALTQVSSPSKVERPTPAPQQPRHVVQPPPPAPPKPVETKPVVQRVQTVQTVQRIEPVVRQEEMAVQQINPVAESIVQHAEPVQQEREMKQTIGPVEQERQAEQTAEPIQKPEAVEVPVAAVISPAPVSQPTPISQAEPAPNTTNEPVVAHLPVQNPQATVENSAPQVVEAPARVQQTAPVAASQTPIERSTMVTSQMRADYSWLTQELLSRLERSKRYPYAARMNRWEGRVVVQAVVRDDGQVVSLRIAESSGHAILDNDAMELIRKISPLYLKHPLGQSQVALLVPVGYSLQ